MDKIVRFIDVHVPITACNFKCHYCYVIKNGIRNTSKTEFYYSCEQVKKALTQERLGGVCHFNLCGHGETLIPEELSSYVRVILENGHYVMIVTNGSLTQRIREYLKFPEELRKRLGFKFSFHYLELKRLGLMDVFFDNLQMIREAGCSISVEMTPSDEALGYKEEIKKIFMDKMGALCHLTVPRDGNKGEIALRSDFTMKEFAKKWGDFDSALFDFKMSIWGKKQKNFCYAGAWSGLLDLSTGDMYACYGSSIHQNIFKDLSKPIQFIAVGKHCKQPHCYNGHAFLSCGTIPSLGENLPSYAQMRDRIDRQGHWLNKEMTETMGQKLYDNNTYFTAREKAQVSIRFYENEMKALIARITRIPNKIRRTIKGDR